MNIEVLCPYRSASKFLEEVRESGGKDPHHLWEQIMIEPYWDRIAEWAPFDHSFMKPKAIVDAALLEAQLDRLSSIDAAALQALFMTIAEALPKMDEDPIRVALYPNADEQVKERQNGVVGSCVFGNILIQVNPLSSDWEKWIPYVFAHEYHHSVWGHHWYVLNGGLEGTFLEYVINEGQADAFARSLFPELTPSWIHALPPEQEKELWNRYEPILNSTDRGLFDSYMFGIEEQGIPWCMGYTFGNKIMDQYRKLHPTVTFSELLALHPKVILEGSGYKGGEQRKE